MESRIVIVGYKPKPGKSEELRKLMLEHWPVLKNEGLVTGRASILMEAKDGTIIEVFEWKSRAAMEQAHINPEVLKMWAEYSEVCSYIPFGQVEESGNLFSEFTPIV